MSTPVATIADALIAFILSLLRDPAAVEEFDAAPQAVLASNGLADACLDDVKAVAPVVIDHPSVAPSPGGHGYKPSNDDPVIKEISRIVHQFTTIDNRTTIVDQSVNQNIWTNGGDVTQVFDQEAIVASGDGSVAAGKDATLDNSETNVTVGDVAIGNTHIEGSTVEGDVNAGLGDGTPVPTVEGALGDLANAGGGEAEAAAAPEAVSSDALLTADLTAADTSYEEVDSSAVADDLPLEDLPEE